MNLVNLANTLFVPALNKASHDALSGQDKRKHFKDIFRLSNIFVVFG
jgi:hypothetical protein